MDAYGGQQSPRAGTDEKVDTDTVTDDGTAEDGMGETVANVAHAPQNDIDPNETAQGAHQHGCEQAVAKEFILPGGEQRWHSEDRYRWGRSPIMMSPSC